MCSMRGGGVRGVVDVLCCSPCIVMLVKKCGGNSFIPGSDSDILVQRGVALKRLPDDAVKWGITWNRNWPIDPPPGLSHRRTTISRLSGTTKPFGIPTVRREASRALLPASRSSWGHFGRGSKLPRSCSRCANISTSQSRLRCDIPGTVLLLARAMLPGLT